MLTFKNTKVLLQSTAAGRTSCFTAGVGEEEETKDAAHKPNSTLGTWPNALFPPSVVNRGTTANKKNPLWPKRAFFPKIAGQKQWQDRTSTLNFWRQGIVRHACRELFRLAVSCRCIMGVIAAWCSMGGAAKLIFTFINLYFLHLLDAFLFYVGKKKKKHPKYWLHQQHTFGDASIFALTRRLLLW